MLPRPGDRSSVRQQIEFEKSFRVMCVWSVALWSWLTLSWSAEILNAETNSRSFEDTILVSTPISEPGNTRCGQIGPGGRQHPGTRYLWIYVLDLCLTNRQVSRYWFLSFQGSTELSERRIQNGSAHKSFNYGRTQIFRKFEAPSLVRLLHIITSVSLEPFVWGLWEEVGISVPSEYFKTLE